MTDLDEFDPDVQDIVEAFREVLGYAHAYRSGAPAGPEYGWAIRNFNEVVADIEEDCACG